MRKIFIILLSFLSTLVCVVSMNFIIFNDIKNEKTKLFFEYSDGAIKVTNSLDNAKNVCDDSSNYSMQILFDY